MVVRNVPWWGLASAVAAPAVLVGAWTLAAALQVRPYSAIADTVSQLAEKGSADSWVMTLAFVVIGALDIITGLALRPAAWPGRIMLMAAGIAGMTVAANPERIGGSVTHACWAAAGFAGLTLWPLFACRRGPGVPWGLRPAVSAWAVVVLAGFVAWFVAELLGGGGQVGVAERAVGEAQALWPLAVVLSCRTC